MRTPLRFPLLVPLAGAFFLGCAAPEPTSEPPTQELVVSDTTPAPAPSPAARAPAKGWLDDARLWAPVADTTSSDCPVQSARLPNPAIPRRIWTSCGDGCRETAALLPSLSGGAALEAGVVADDRDGEIVYRVSTAMSPDGGEDGIDEVRRLSDDVPIGILRHPPRCLAIAAPHAPQLVGLLAVGGAEADLAIGNIDPTTGVFRVAMPTFELGSGANELFAVQNHWGVIRDQSRVEMALAGPPGGLTEVFASAAFQYHAAGRGDLVVWSDWSDWTPSHRARLRAHLPSKGSFVIAQGEGDIVYSAVTDQRLIWLEASGPLSVQGDYASLRLVWATRNEEAKSLERHEGPLLPQASKGVSGLVAHGDWVALVGGDGTSQGVVLANLATGSVALYPDRPGRTFGAALAVNDHEVLLRERAAGASDSTVDRLLRLDLESVQAQATRQDAR